ncbi:hypothetical protein ACIOG4_27805 [Streptomyces microflavus]|uniref:hypothetical protein n=1 Tax=Streptomyces microflavus TaxID=1919 RepID=UPI0037F60647
MNVRPLTADQRHRIAGLLGPAKPALNGLIDELAVSVRDCAQHDHASQREDWYCQNLLAFCGERAGPVLRRLLEAEAEVERLTAQADELPRGTTHAVRAAVDSGQRAPAGPRHRVAAEGGAVPHRWRRERRDRFPPLAPPRGAFEAAVPAPASPPRS